MWKSTNNEIQERDASGQLVRVRFRCLDAVAVPEAIDLLMAEIRTALDCCGKDELLWIPLPLLDFLCIHPFTDGNGRVGRLLTLLQRAVGGRGPRRLLPEPGGLIPRVA